MRERTTVPWGSETFYYDGVGNRIEHRATPPGGSQTIATVGYPATSNRVTQITQNATTVRSIGYDAAGNITSDSRLGSVYAYTYNHANRLKTVSYEGNLRGTYTYNGLHQLITRVVSNSGSLDGTTQYVHDRSGNVIAELNASGATVREYIWLPEAEIAPTAASRAEIDRPIAVVDGVGVASPATYYVHTDHLHRPIRMSNAVKSIVWSADYQPWGAVQSLSGALTLDLRFPGQWFQLEAGLHYNWHRHYDASLGRYTQPDPLGFVDGPSVYGYAGGSPQSRVDQHGLRSTSIRPPVISPPRPRFDPYPRPRYFREPPGGGGGGGSTGGGGHQCDDDDPTGCKSIWETDIQFCDTSYWGANGWINISCHEWANNNLQKCLAGSQRQDWREVISSITRKSKYAPNKIERGIWRKR